MVCNQEFSKREKERPNEFNERQTCSKECKNLLVSRAYAKYPTSKICEICGEEFFKGPKQKPAVFYRKKTCSKECLSMSKTKNAKLVLPSKTCIVCGKEFSRREHETTTDFYSRQTCSKFGDDLIMVETFGKPRYNSNYEYELLRLCTKPGFQVTGGPKESLIAS